MQFERIMCFRWRDISFVELNGRTCESALRIAALALQGGGQTDCDGPLVGFAVALEPPLRFRLAPRVGNTNGMSGFVAVIKFISHRQCHVLTVITNSVVLEGRAPL